MKSAKQRTFYGHTFDSIAQLFASSVYMCVQIKAISNFTFFFLSHFASIALIKWMSIVVNIVEVRGEKKVSEEEDEKVYKEGLGDETIVGGMMLTHKISQSFTWILYLSSFRNL